MPDAPPPKALEHPLRLPLRRDDAGPRVPHHGEHVRFAELCCRTNFSFLRGASHAHELAITAAQLGYAALGVADTNRLAGVVRMHVAARKLGLPIRVGCRLLFTRDGHPPDADHPPIRVVVYPTDVASYGRLCQLLTLGKRRAPKGTCQLGLHDVVPAAADRAAPWLGLLRPPRDVDDTYLHAAAALADAFGQANFFVAASPDYRHDDADRLRRHADLAAYLHVPLLATNDPLYHVPQRRPLHDIMTCIRHGRTLDDAGYLLSPHAERFLKTPEEMARLFRDFPGAIERTADVADRVAGFSLDQLRYQYPGELVPDGLSAMQHLTELAHAGAGNRFDGGVAGMSPRIRQQFDHELELIAELNYPHYFLTVEDIVRFARSQGILCQGRGAAANSIVCYCLGITDADPRKINTLFERFVSRQRDEPPDIDIDFEHQRREEVIQYLYRKYGRDRAALTAEVITYRGRSAVREVGKALGLSLDTVDRLAKGIDWWHGGPVQAGQLRELKLDPIDPTIRHLVRWSTEIQGFPRHLGQHVGGFVLTEKPLCALVPIENAAMPDRTVIEWDKDDIDAVGMLKVDVLGLGMLSVMRRCFDLVRQDHADAPTCVAAIPHDDPATFAMIQRADTVGVFQIESRAQMVHPYLRRRRGEEAVTYPDDKVERILGKTLGVPLFQEQAMQLAIECAGFSPDDADQLRRAVTGFKHVSMIEAFGERIVGGMLTRGYDAEFAQRCFTQIKGFSTYGFPESHAASFALLSYASSYLKCHYPAAFCAALLNSQPMGFYAPAQLVQDAQRHGVEIRRIDVNHSRYECTLESGEHSTGGVAVRLGLNRVRGLQAHDALQIEAATRDRSFTNVESLWRAAGCSAAAMRRLAAADAFASMGLDRQQAVWETRKLRDAAAPLFEGARQEKERHGGTEAQRHEGKAKSSTSFPSPLRASVPPCFLPNLPELRHVERDYDTTGVTLRNHPMSFLRHELRTRGVATAEQLADAQHFPQGARVAVAGICLVRQRPGSAKSITFMTLEDETGTSNLVVYPDIFDREIRVARHATAMVVHGRIDRAAGVVHVKAYRFVSLDERFQTLRDTSRNFR